jgi:hypothetical protein
VTSSASKKAILHHTREKENYNYLISKSRTIMNVKTDSSAKFVWTEIKVEVDRGVSKYRVTPLQGLYPIKLNDTNGTVREYFKNDLIKGPDRFLVGVWEVGDNYYNFELIMKTDIPEEVFEYIDPISKFVVQQNLTEPTVMTFR